MGLIALECKKIHEREGLVGYTVQGMLTQGDDSLDGKGIILSMQDMKGEIVGMYDPSRMTMDEAILKVLNIEEK